jgi:hypothetical protein
MLKTMRPIVLAFGLSLFCFASVEAADPAQPAPAAAPAPAAEPALPERVAKALGENVAICTSAGGTAGTQTAIKRADFNGDGNDDFVFDVGSIQCEGAASIYGDREKLVQVFIADGAGGATSGYRGLVYGVKLEGTGKDAKVWVTMAGKGCGKEPAKSFSEESFCNRQIVWNAETKKIEIAPVSAAQMIE